MVDITPIVTSIGIPIVALIINSIVRHRLDLAPSPGSDFMLLLGIFNMNVILAPEQFRPLIPNPLYQHNILGINAMLLSGAALGWLASVMFIERPIADAYISSNRRSLSFRVAFLLMVSWFLAASIAAANLYVFVWSGDNA